MLVVSADIRHQILCFYVCT